MDQLGRPPAAALARNLDPGQLWILGLIVNGDGEIVPVGPSDAGFWSECNCPECLHRDNDVD